MNFEAMQCMQFGIEFQFLLHGVHATQLACHAGSSNLAAKELYFCIRIKINVCRSQQQLPSIDLNVNPIRNAIQCSKTISSAVDMYSYS